MTTSNSVYYPPGVDLRFRILSAAEEKELFRKSRAGDETSREFLIKNHMLFAAMVARKLAKGKLPDEEVLSAANLALMKAFRGFKYERGSRFSSYLRFFIRGEVTVLWKRYYVELAETDDDSEAPQSVSNPHEEAAGAEHLRFLASLIQEFKGTLNDHEQEVLALHYEQGQSFAEIARGRGVTREAVRASHARALCKLKKAFKRKGITTLK